jgi:hypothetical protein
MGLQQPKWTPEFLVGSKASHATRISATRISVKVGGIQSTRKEHSKTHPATDILHQDQIIDLSRGFSALALNHLATGVARLQRQRARGEIEVEVSEQNDSSLMCGDRLNVGLFTHRGITSASPQVHPYQFI